MRRKTIMAVLLILNMLGQICADDDGRIGPQGPQGVQGPQGIAGHNGSNGSNGTNGTNGANGVNGTNGKDGDTGLDAFKTTVGVGVRWYDWEHVALASGYQYDIHYGGHTFDMLVVQIKLGESYEQREIVKLRKQLRLK